MARYVFKGCECGALSTYGFGPGEVGHSHWCPWSTDLVAIPWFCENSECMEATVRAAIDPRDFAAAGIHYFCKKCWDANPLQLAHSKHWSVTPSPRE